MEVPPVEGVVEVAIIIDRSQVVEVEEAPIVIVAIGIIAIIITKMITVAAEAEAVDEAVVDEVEVDVTTVNGVVIGKIPTPVTTITIQMDHRIDVSASKMYN